MSEPSFTCPACRRVSHHPKDVEHRFCSACHVFWLDRDMSREEQREFFKNKIDSTNFDNTIYEE